MSNYGYGQNRYDDRGEQPQYNSGGYGNPQPYDSRPTYDTPPPQQYGRQPQYNQPSNGRDEYDDQSVELKSLVANGQEYGNTGATDSNYILDESQAIKQAISSIVNFEIPKLQRLQSKVATNPDILASSADSPEKKMAELQQDCAKLVNDIKTLKMRPDYASSKYKAHVNGSSKALSDAIQQLRVIESDFNNQFKAQVRRQYLIVNPNATDDELRSVEDHPDQPVFAQALMQSNRRGQAQTTLSAVKERHQAIEKITEQFVQLAELFQEMETLVVQQEAAVVNIEMKGEEVVENMDKGTAQIGVAVQSAKNARKWKWWCLGICVLIVVIIVIIVLLYQFVFGPNAKSNRDATKQKRWVLPSADVFALPASKPCSKSKSASNIKVPGLEFTENFELIRRARHFQA